MADVHPAEITALLGRLSDGDAGAREALLPLVYADLEAIARGQIVGERVMRRAMRSLEQI